MRGWRAVGVAAAVSLASLIVVAALLEFLAPDLAYQLKDRSAEVLSGNRGRKFRVALGSKTGSSYRVGTILNRYLRSKAGYELELVVDGFARKHRCAPGSEPAHRSRRDQQRGR